MADIDPATGLLDGTEPLTTIKLPPSAERTSLPRQILARHGATLVHLDLSGSPLSSLPASVAGLTALRRAFFSSCRFSVFPSELAACPALEMVAFRSNGMAVVPEDAFPARLRWLILTDNRIAALPRSIGRCARLQKCILTGNQLAELPAEMGRCEKLGLLRLAANRIEHLPPWLLRLPELAFLALAGNPCCAPAAGSSPAETVDLPDADWADVEPGDLLGEGASGVISRARWRGEDVAVKLFRGSVTSDGTPLDEMAACIAAGPHPNLVAALARIANHPAGQHGLLMPLVPPSYKILGRPPSMETCTRDCFPEAEEEGRGTLTPAQALRVLGGVAAAARHLHARGVVHADLYAHNILTDPDGDALLGDFGAAAVYRGTGVAAHAEALQRLEVLAFGHLVEDVVGLMKGERGGEREQAAAAALRELHSRCVTREVDARPLFVEVCEMIGQTSEPS